MRMRRSRITPLERRIIAVRYRDGEPVKNICADYNCSVALILSCADYHSFDRRRPLTNPQKRRPKSPPCPIVLDIP